MATSRTTRGDLRRKLLAIGGVGAVLGLAQPATPAYAGHNEADLGIGIDNPADAALTPTAAATTTTLLRTAVGDGDGLRVAQQADINGYAIAGLGSAGATGTFSGGQGVKAGGGPLTGGTPGSARSGGNGMLAFGGSGDTFGNGGQGIQVTGGSSTAFAPGPGISSQGGHNLASASAIGGTGVVGRGGSSDGDDDTGIGVHGSSDTHNGVEGESKTTVSTRGAVKGTNLSSGFGVYGQSSGGVGMRGVSFGAVSAGVEGVASGSGPGVWGFTSSGHAVLGNSTSGNGGVFSSSTGYGVSVQSTTGGVGVYSKVGATKFAFVGEGKLTCTGTGHFDGGVVVSSRMADGSLRATAAVTSPETLVEDVGRARLVNGSARVELDRQFASLIITADYAVFPVPNGDCKGLYVASKSASSFEVRELQSGTSSIDFDYRIVAKRTGTAALARFAKVDEPPPPPRFPEMPERPRPESVTRAERPTSQPTRSSNGSSVGAPNGSPPRPRR
jgi:hypothetical protein